MRCHLALAACAALAGCGSAGGADRPDATAALLLDAPPNAVHAGIFSAVRRGYDEAEGVHLRVRAPAKGADVGRALVTGSAAFAILDLHALARERERGRDLVALLALVQQPLLAIARSNRVDARGAPSYPELVVAATRATVDTDPALCAATVRALARGYRFTLSDPPSSAEDLIAAHPGLDPARVRARLDVLDAALVGASGAFGVLDTSALRRWAAWEARVGIVRRAPDVARAFDPRFAAAAAREESG